MKRRKAGRPPGGVNGQRVRDYPQVSIRVPPKLYAQLGALTKQTGLSRLEIFMRAIDCYWWSRPTSLDDRPGLNYLVPPHLHWMDIVIPPALFGIWLSFMLLLLRTRPLLARVEHSPFEEQHGASHHAHAAA